MTARDAVADLRAIAFALERAGEAAYRVKAFRKAADAVGALPADEVTRRAGDGTLTKVPGIGEVTARCVAESLAGEEPVYLRRLLAAVANPHVDILGHCTGRIVRADSARAGGRTRPPSEFDAPAVFAACAEYGVAVEVNSRPDRLDPPKRLLRLAEEAGCLFAVDSDAHAPGQLDWLRTGCERAARCGVRSDRIVNTWPVAELLAWAGGHGTR